VPSRAVTLAALAFAAVETGIETGAGLWGYLFLTAGRGLGYPAAGLAMCGLCAAEPPGRAERPIGDRACAPGGARAADPRPGLRRRAPAPLVEHWDGRAWHRVALPRGLVKPGGPYYPATAAAGPRNLWVFGIDGQWLHWDGAWTTGTLSDATDLDASAMFGPRDVWTFGVLDPNTRPRPYAARYDGSRWHRVAVPGHDGVDGVSAVSPRDIWAVLGAPQTGAWTGPGALVHWNGRRWHAVRLPARLATPRLGSVLARSATDVWAGGATRNRDRGSTEAIGHWNGRRWSVVTLPAPASRVHCHLTQLAADGAGGIWAIGPCANCQRIPSRLWHERGSVVRPARAQPGPAPLDPVRPGRRRPLRVGRRRRGRLRPQRPHRPVGPRP
jgi:hypothetical protein